jgi:hypothetical protein
VAAFRPDKKEIHQSRETGHGAAHRCDFGPVGGNQAQSGMVCQTGAQFAVGLNWR